MNGDQHGAGSLRERVAGGAEDRLGKALSDLLDSPVISGAIGKAFDAREKAAQAQELAMGALNLPSAADIERLTRRLRSLSQRLEGIEDAMARMDRGTSQRLGAIEEQLKGISAKVEALAAPSTADPAKAKPPVAVQRRAATKPRPATKPSAAVQERAAPKPPAAGEGRAAPKQPAAGEGRAATKQPAAGEGRAATKPPTVKPSAASKPRQ